ncbi:30S ribosomal protein S6 [Candidatus Parcubacteria bacterium]|nr:30S ribosomal protein S6 [Candidatus Parcubacteria bacterium]
MKSYQLTYIVSSEVPSDSMETVKKDIETFVQEHEGVILSAEKTTPQMLAYPVNKRSSGYFITLEFQSPEDKIKELGEKIKKEKNVLRHAILVKKPSKPKKPRRTRKPMDQATAPKAAPDKGKSNVEAKDLDKKLDEILSE